MAVTTREQTTLNDPRVQAHLKAAFDGRASVKIKGGASYKLWFSRNGWHVNRGRDRKNDYLDDAVHITLLDGVPSIFEYTLRKGDQ